jgi:hypothetical protein
VVVAVEVTPTDDFRSQANIRRKSLFLVKNARQMRIRAQIGRALWGRPPGLPKAASSDPADKLAAATLGATGLPVPLPDDPLLVVAGLIADCQSKSTAAGGLKTPCARG